MNNQFRKILSLALFLTASSPSLFAYDAEIDGIFYNLILNGKVAEVTYKDENFNSYSGDILIPSSITHNGIEYTVASIAERAFFDCNSLTSIEIPNSVTEIGAYAFSGCSSLTSVEIPNSVTTILEYTFFDCSSLISAIIPNSVTEIGSVAFYGCSSLVSFEIPNSVTEIAYSVFSNCSGLLSVMIPNSVTTIGMYAFQNCYSLPSIEIPGSVTTIERYAFRNCSSLKTVHIFGAPTFSSSSSSAKTFANCPSLEDFYCLAETPASAPADVFEKSNVESATLHVPSESIELYGMTSPWSQFGTIIATDGTVSAPKLMAARPMSFSRQGDAFLVSGAPAGTRIAVHTMDGRLVATATAATDGTARLAVTAGQAYVVTIGQQTFKVVSK